MKIRGAKKVHYDSGPNMTPLVDVVMVILIFLMLAGSFRGEEHYLISNTPIQSKGVGNVKLPAGYVPPTTVNVKLQLDTAYVPEVDPNLSPEQAKEEREKQMRYIARIGGNAPAHDFKQLRSQFGGLAANYKKAGKDLDTVEVVIAPESGVLYHQVIDAYQAALDAGFKKIGFASLQ